MTIRYHIDLSTADGYRQFLKVKALPSYSFRGRTAYFPDEYAERLGIEVDGPADIDYKPHSRAFDYQRDIVALALAKKRFAIFADCGLGKTLMILDWAKHVSEANPNSIVLIISPLMVVGQTIEEAEEFYGDSLTLERVPAAKLPDRLHGAGGIVITNYAALTDNVQRGNVGAVVLDESSMLKSHYGKWAGHCLRIGAGVDWKLCCTGTPAPNDRIEYANHAVFLGAFPTVNSFLARFFVNRGQTSDRWQLKGHALGPFYRALAHWCIFLTDPSVYGWKDGCEIVPPIHVHIHDVPLTPCQQSVVHDTGSLFVVEAGGIATRGMLGQAAKGKYQGRKIDTNKPAFIRELIDSWPDESTIIWCRYNDEQESIVRAMGESAASITGSTKFAERDEIIKKFKSGKIKTLVTKPKILGFGLNLQIATRQVFSGLQDSYEEFYQAVKRSNRIGSTRPLNVHIPVTALEAPMVSNVLRKADMVEKDTRQQEQEFRSACQVHVSA